LPFASVRSHGFLAFQVDQPLSAAMSSAAALLSLETIDRIEVTKVNIPTITVISLSLYTNRTNSTNPAQSWLQVGRKIHERLEVGHEK
jgi:hypothetical protein